MFTTLTKPKILIEEWRKEYNQVRPHSALDYRAPAPETIIPLTLNLTSGTVNGGRSDSHRIIYGGLNMRKLISLGALVFCIIALTIVGVAFAGQEEKPSEKISITLRISIEDMKLTRKAESHPFPHEIPWEKRPKIIEGEATIKISVAPTGEVVDVEIIHSSDWPALDEEMCKILYQWKFTPVDEAGIKVYQAKFSFGPKDAEPEVPTVKPLAPVFEAPVFEAPVFEAPVFEAPVFEAPVFEAPVFEAPVFEVPVFEAPVFEVPVFEVPVFEVPVVKVPVVKVPVFEAPVFEVPVFEVPVVKALPPKVEPPTLPTTPPPVEAATPVIPTKLVTPAVPMRIAAAPNELTLVNETEFFALVRIKSKTDRTTVVEVPIGPGCSATINLPSGDFFEVVRFGKEPDSYHYVKGEGFQLAASKSQFTKATLTLHRVPGGDYVTQPCSAEEFEDSP